jgi:hypothetical protein
LGRENAKHNPTIPAPREPVLAEGEGFSGGALPRGLPRRWRSHRRALEES